MNTSRPPPEEAGAHTDALPALGICAACLEDLSLEMHFEKPFQIFIVQLIQGIVTR